jgi:hypothetical protein
MAQSTILRDGRVGPAGGDYPRRAAVAQGRDVAGRHSFDGEKHVVGDAASTLSDTGAGVAQNE